MLKIFFGPFASPGPLSIFSTSDPVAILRVSSTLDLHHGTHLYFYLEIQIEEILEMTETDFQKTWEFVELKLDQLWDDGENGLSLQVYRQIQTKLKDYQGTLNMMESVGEHTDNDKTKRQWGRDLYDALNDYLSPRLDHILDRLHVCPGRELVQLYSSEWGQYEFWAECVNIVFRPINQNWVKMQIDCGRKDIWEAYVLCLIRWKRGIFDHIKERMLTAILELIKDHRDKIPIDHVALNTAIQSFATLGVDILNDPTRSNLDLYWRYFEIPFLKATTEYYDSASSTFLETHCIIDYLHQVQVWLSQERTLVSDCFHPDTCGPLIRTCRKALLEDRVILIGEEFLRHLEGDNQSELKLMLNLLSTTHKAMDQFHLRFSQHLSKVELSTAVSAKGMVDSSMANAYVGELLKLHTHYQTLLETLFVRDAKFVRCFDEWFLKFVNHNNLCQSSSIKSAMLLAAHADSLLRESSHSMPESELAEWLTSIMKIFQYLADKDAFHLAYSKRMADRFLKGRSASVQAEKLMIGILREACGNDCTRKLETMLEDTKISSALNIGFQSWLCEGKRAGVCAGLSFQVLRAGSWPFAIDGNPAGTFLFVPPKTIAYAHALFLEFYTARHNGRKLIWMWHLCNGELQANFKASYIFRVSAYQMAILLLFNDRTTVSYDFIELCTGLGGSDLLPVLLALMNVGVLIASPPGTNPGRDTRFSINPNFKSNKRIVSFRPRREDMKQDGIKKDEIKQGENGTIKEENEKKRLPLFRRPYRRGPSWGKC